MTKIGFLAFFGLLAGCHPQVAQNGNPSRDVRPSPRPTDPKRPLQIAGSPPIDSSDIVLVKRQRKPPNSIPKHTWCGKDGWSIAAEDAALAIQKLKIPRGTIDASCPNLKQPCHETFNARNIVVVEAFQIDPELITHAAYRACVAAKQCAPLVSVPPPPEAPNYQSMPSNYPEQACGGDPVFFASVKLAEAYCRWRGERLPSEPELRMAYEYGSMNPPIEAKLWVEGIYTPANLGVSEILQGYYSKTSHLVGIWYNGEFKVGGVGEVLGSATAGFRCVAP
jgi:formylglycine-generating enzyme required for sulfatase activity